MSLCPGYSEQPVHSRQKRETEREREKLFSRIQGEVTRQAYAKPVVPVPIVNALHVTDEKNVSQRQKT